MLEITLTRHNLLEGNYRAIMNLSGCSEREGTMSLLGAIRVAKEALGLKRELDNERMILKLSNMRNLGKKKWLVAYGTATGYLANDEEERERMAQRVGIEMSVMDKAARELLEQG